MSVQIAFTFIKHLREQPDLRERAREAYPIDSGLEGLCRFAADNGYVFTVESLRKAYRYDWGLRWLQGRGRTCGPAEKASVVQPYHEPEVHDQR